MDEYIEREALLKWALDSMDAQRDVVGTAYCAEFVRAIRQFNAADVAPVVHGRWMDVPYVYFGAKRYECSNCYSDVFWNNRIQTTKDNYCPNCGCRMDLE